MVWASFLPSSSTSDMVITYSWEGPRSWIIVARLLFPQRIASVSKGCRDPRQEHNHEECDGIGHAKGDSRDGCQVHHPRVSREIGHSGREITKQILAPLF